MQDVISGCRNIRQTLPGVTVDYSWLPPWEGCSDPQPNRVKVIFSKHDQVALAHEGRTCDVAVRPGGVNVMGEEDTRTLRVAEHSETIDLYPDMALLAAESGEQLPPSIVGNLSRGAHVFDVDPILLTLAMRFRRHCLGTGLLSDIEASTLAAALTTALLAQQRGAPEKPQAKRLNTSTLARLFEYVEANLSQQLTLADMADVCRTSPWHFAREFHQSMGLTPWQYVLGRRMELAKRLLVNADMPVHEVAWETGFENISHFRRQFHRHVGLNPGAFRTAIRN